MTYNRILFTDTEFFFLDNFEILSEIELCSLLLKFGEFVVVFANFLQTWLDTGKTKRELMLTFVMNASNLSNFLTISHGDC